MPDLHIGVTFKVCGNGRIGDLKLVHSSGSPSADAQALQAVQNAIPLHPLPPGSRDFMEVQFNFDKASQH